MDESHATSLGDGRGRGAFGPTTTSAATAPAPEVSAKAQRRRFTAEYRLRILKQADACKRPGELGALLRREGLYSSHLANWRRQREQGALRDMLICRSWSRPSAPEISASASETLRRWSRSRRMSPEPPPNSNSGRDIPSTGNRCFISYCK